MNNKDIYIEEFVDLPQFLSFLANPKKSGQILYRGQSSDKPLLPKIARADPIKDTTVLEKMMLEELRRRGDVFLGANLIDDWDLMVHAQHFGMATRLLDWTSNPLVALWFSCQFAKSNQDSFVYVFNVEDEFLLNRAMDPDPFTRTATRVFKPKLNNSRIIAQNGWFTAHKRSQKIGRFIALENIKDLKKSIIKISVPHTLHPLILIQLDILGINYQTMFPDMEGLCKHINWMHE